MDGRTIVAKFEKSKFNFTYQIEANNEITVTGLIDINTVSIIIPNKVNGYDVTSISEKAFQNRIYLVSVTIPNSIKNIHPKCFNGARMLSEILVDSTNPYFTSDKGVLYTKDMTELRHYPPKNCTSFNVPSTVKKIGDYSFYQHKDGGVGNIVFNEGLVEIGQRAFYECTALTTLRFPSTLKVIGEGAFNCVSSVGCIQQVNFNEGLEVIGGSAFVGAYFKDAFSLPSSIKEIGSYAFANCTAITKFTFPKSLETLGDNAFAGSTGILEIAIETGNENFVINGNVLYTADMKKAVMCPSGNTAKVVIPEGVEEIGDYAFYMVDRTLAYEFPSTLKKIGKQAFAHCYNLKEFTVPNSVTSIGENCFDCCDNLTTLNIGTGLTEIPKQAFIDCYSIKELNIPGNIQTIGQEAFFGCSGLTSIKFNEGLKTINKAAFCFATTEYNSGDTASLSTIELPNSLEVLGNRVFAKQKALTTLKIGDNLQEFGEGILDETNIQNIVVSENNNYLSSEHGILYTKNKERLIYAVSSITGVNGNLSLPEGVKYIEPYEFASCENLTGITLPESLIEVKNNAFEYTKIKEFNFKSNLKKIHDEAFYLSSIEVVTFQEGLEEIGNAAFNSTNISTLKLPNSLKVLGSKAFKGSWKLLSLEFGNGLVTIGDDAFFRSNKLAGEITLPSSIKNLGNGVFANYASITDIKFTGEGDFVSENGILMDKEKTTVYGIAANHATKNVVIPSSVVELKKYGLYGSKMTSLSLPEGLKTIGEEALAELTSLTVIDVPASVTYIGPNAFKKFKKTINFNCTEDYALQHFDVQYLGSIGSTAVVNYKG